MARRPQNAARQGESDLSQARHASRRALPWVKIETAYTFEGPQGKCALADLFRGRSQLAVYHYMLTASSDHICKGCSYIADHVDGARKHFEHADLAFAAVSRAPIEQIELVRRRMGWTFPWLSSNGADFNYDFGVLFRKEDIEAGRALYNYGSQTIKSGEDMHGTSIFAMNDAGNIFHAYSTYGRGDEVLVGAFAWLDLTPKGRNESGGIMSWLKPHDEYGR